MNCRLNPLDAERQGPRAQSPRLALWTLCDKSTLSRLEPVGGSPVELWLLCVGELHDGSSLFRLIDSRPIAERPALSPPPGRTGETKKPALEGAQKGPAE